MKSIKKIIKKIAKGGLVAWVIVAAVVIGGYFFIAQQLDAAKDREAKEAGQAAGRGFLSGVVGGIKEWFTAGSDGVGFGGNIAKLYGGE